MPVNLGALAKLTNLSPSLLTPVLFAGEKAQGVDTNLVDIAKTLIARGQSPQEVYEKTTPKNPESTRTGWFQGDDGKWRFEIDDSKSQFNENAFENLKRLKDVNLKDLLNHPELYQLYPDVSNIKLQPLTLQEMDSGLKGYYDKETNTLSLHTDPKIARSTLMHELQHFIQKKEGFASGGSEEAIKPFLSSDLTLKFLEQRLKNAQEMINRGSQLEGQKKEVTPEMYNLMVDRYIEDQRQKNKKFNELQQKSENELNLKLQDLSDYDVYRRLGGETEARNVQTRLPMSIKERRQKLPTETQEFSSSEQFIRGQ